MGLQLIAPPAADPITLLEAKRNSRADENVSAEDALFMSLIRRATADAQRITGRQIVAATWKETFDCFPCRELRLSLPPLISVSSITYIDASGNTQTMDAARYKVSVGRDPGIITRAYAQSWPVVRREIDAIAVTFVCGHPVTTIAAEISSGAQTVTPASMAGIIVGSVLGIDTGAAAEQVRVTAVADTTFTATFAQSHVAGAKVNCVPEDIRDAIKLIVSDRYRFRGDSDDAGERPPCKAAVDLLLANWYGGYP